MFVDACVDNDKIGTETSNIKNRARRKKYKHGRGAGEVEDVNAT